MRGQSPKLPYPTPLAHTTPPHPPPLQWRFFWRLEDADRPRSTQFPDLNAEPVVPAAFPEWRQVMDGWGGKSGVVGAAVGRVRVALLRQLWCCKCFGCGGCAPLFLFAHCACPPPPRNTAHRQDAGCGGHSG